jgi:SH3-like domain-containing protein
MLIFRHPDETSYPIARLQFGVIANIKKCSEQWCKIKVDKHTGWIRKENILGVYPDEIIG